MEMSYEPSAAVKTSEGDYRDSSTIDGANGDYTASLEGDEDGSDGDGAHAEDGSRKKPKLARPMCTNCEQCQIRKGKCDRGRPRCGWCEANDKPCEYKERKKPGLRAGYGRDLERRLFKVEEMLENHTRILEEVTASATAASRGAPPQQGIPSTASHEVQSFHSTPQQAPYQTSHSDSPRPSQASGSFFAGTTNAEQYRLQAASPTFSPGISNAIGTAVPPITNGSPAFQQHQQYQELPPYDLLYSLVDLYFTHVNTWCPILERRSTLNFLFGSSAQDEADKILLHAIIVTTMRFSADPRLTEASRREYHASSKQKVLIYGLENSSVKALQALVILALDFVGSSNKAAGLNLIAMIVRSVVQLGLATESFSPSMFPDYPSISTLRANNLPDAGSWIEDESRRRLFWMIYVLDRDATVATAFEFALDEKDIDRKLPCRAELFARNQPVDTKWFRSTRRDDYSMNKPQNLGAFSYMVEVKYILSQIHIFLKRPVDISALADVERWQLRYRELDSTLRAWQSKLPNEFVLGRLSTTSDSQRPPMTSGWILLQTTYYTTLVRLHSSAAYPPHKSPIFSPSYAASQQCYSSVENIIALAKYVVHHSMLSHLGPPFAFSIWVAARVLLVHGSTIEKHVSQDIHFLVDTLQDIGRHWPIAARYGSILRRVVSDLKGEGGEKGWPSSVAVLADMRRCAYDLDTLISHQPRPGLSLSTPSLAQDHSTASANTLSHAQQATSVRGSTTAGGNELEYLETFDFFNYPRLANGNGGSGNGNDMLDPSLQRMSDANQFNITNFEVDVNSDWLAAAAAGNLT